MIRVRNIVELYITMSEEGGNLIHARWVVPWAQLLSPLERAPTQRLDDIGKVIGPGGSGGIALQFPPRRAAIQDT
jgi:hypothetical protein